MKHRALCALAALLLAVCAACAGERETGTTAAASTAATTTKSTTETARTAADTVTQTTAATTVVTTAAQFAAATTAKAAASDKNSFRFTTYEVEETLYNKAGGYAELLLTMPKLTGSYAGIPKINRFFAERENEFRNEVKTEILPHGFPQYKGVEDNFYRSAEYGMKIVFGNIISISGQLNGGAGGVSWGAFEGYTFDLTNGKRLVFSDLFALNEREYTALMLRLIAEKITKNIQDPNEPGYDFEDAYSDEGAKAIREHFELDQFYFSETAFVVYYEKYALAPGAGGPQLIEIPYAKIADSLKPSVRKYLK